MDPETPVRYRKGRVMSFFRPCVEEMQAYVPGEQPKGQTFIKLNTNENPYPPSPQVAAAIARELGGSGARLRLYSDPHSTEFRSRAAEVFSVSADQVMAGNGSDELLSLLIRSMVEPGEVIAYPFPTYVLYQTLAQAQGAKVVSIDFPDDYSLPSGLFGCDARLVFIANPNSPSGTSFPAVELRALAQSIRGVLVIDEAYADFARESALDLVRTEPNVVVLRTLSKSYSLAGMRLGLLFSSEAIVQGLNKVRDSYNLDRLAIVAGAAALKDQAWMQANVEKIRATRQHLVTTLTNFGLSVLPSQANFVFADFGSVERAQSAQAFLRERGILVRYFSLPRLDAGLRITIGTDAEVKALLDALGDFTA
jgi:histidinol-phosphate aminotransferase